MQAEVTSLRTNQPLPPSTPLPQITSDTIGAASSLLACVPQGKLHSQPDSQTPPRQSKPSQADFRSFQGSITRHKPRRSRNVLQATRKRVSNLPPLYRCETRQQMLYTRGMRVGSIRKPVLKVAHLAAGGIFFLTLTWQSGSSGAPRGCRSYHLSGLPWRMRRCLRPSRRCEGRSPALRPASRSPWRCPA